MRQRNVLTIGMGLLALHLLASSASAYYSPRLGRFLSRDPLHEPGAVLLRTHKQPKSFIPRDPVGRLAEQNIYRFVLNNPTNLVDPHGLVCNITVHRAEKKKTDDGKNIGHEWIETENTSYGFWPSGNIWLSAGVIENPDPYEGDRSGQLWQTGQKSWGITAGWLDYRARLNYGFGKGVCCKYATCQSIKDCLDKYAAQTNHIYTVTKYHCRWWVDEALKECCLYRK